MLTIPSVISLLIVTLSLFIGASSLWIGMSMGRTREKWQALLAFSAAFYAIAEVPLTLDVDPQIVIWGMRIQVLGAAVHVLAWMHYEQVVRLYDTDEEHSPSRAQRALDLGLIFAAILCLIPSISYSDAIVVRRLNWLGGVYYNDPTPAFLTDLTFGVMLGLLFLIMVRFGISTYRGIAEARFNTVAVAGLLLFGLLDLLTANKVLNLPYVLSIGLFFSVVVSWIVITDRFVQNAQKVKEASKSLAEMLVGQTLELNRSHEELERAERLAGLGRLAAGVAHEINNPAAVVLSNLQVVLDSMETRANWSTSDQEDLTYALERSIVQMNRVEGIVNDMLIAGRVAGSKESFDDVVLLLPIVESALEAAAIEEIPVRIDMPKGLKVIGHDRVIFPIVRNLLTNARDAQNDSGSKLPITLDAQPEGDVVTIRVTDSGSGISDENVAKMFEPFYTTKEPGLGTGLGLSVSMGLVRALGGSLHCESVIGQGTTMTLKLPTDQPT